VSTTLVEPATPPEAKGAPDRSGGRPARRAMIRWGWRLFRREWRQQLLVLALLSVAVAATTVGLAVVTNATKGSVATFTLPGNDPKLASDVAAFQRAFSGAEVAYHESVSLPGSVATVDVRSQSTDGGRGGDTLRLLTGRYPTGSGEVAMTRGTAANFGLSLGQTWREGNQVRRLVGLVENPQDLGDQFALVAPGQVAHPVTVTIFTHASPHQVQTFRAPSRIGLSVASQSAASRTAQAIGVLALGTLGLIFVGLLATAGFAVMAQRRLRALGMLASIGATYRHVRLVMLANGAAVGAFGAVVGTATGFAVWLVVAPHVESIAGHRIDRMNLPWWAIGAAMGLALVTSVAAAWWPARTVARVPVVAALSGRPPRPSPAHRSAALGGLLVGGGICLIALADRTQPLLVVAGIVCTVVGALLLAPLAIRGAAAAGGRSPVAIRLALRDLVRYQARSGAALGAVTLAIVIGSTIAITSTRQAAEDKAAIPNVAANQLIVYLSPLGSGGGPVPQLTADQLRAAQAAVDRIAGTLHTGSILSLDAAVDPSEPLISSVPGSSQQGHDTAAILQVQSAAAPPGGEPGGSTGRQGTGAPAARPGRGPISINLVATLYVATPQVLARYRIKPAQVEPSAEVISSRKDLGGLQLGFGGNGTWVQDPKIQVVPGLPADTSLPNSLITMHAVNTMGLALAPSAWLVDAASPLTPTEINTARQIAASAGVTIETQSKNSSNEQLGIDATTAGLLLALGVLAMTVGLIRSETARDLRTLTATGAGSGTRRMLTAATAGTLALLGALLGVAASYVALAAFFHGDLASLGHVPYANLAIILGGLPLAATAGGWLLAGREPPAIARQPIG
jgi:putative ABC transport system permease protein